MATVIALAGGVGVDISGAVRVAEAARREAEAAFDAQRVAEALAKEQQRVQDVQATQRRERARRIKHEDMNALRASMPDDSHLDTEPEQRTATSAKSLINQTQQPIIRNNQCSQHDRVV